ncbi:unnamed protein product [Camellia sinensis]
MCISYSILGHSNCMVRNNIDFLNMLRVVCARGVDIVDVSVTRCSTFDEEDEVGSNWVDVVGGECDRLMDIEKNSLSKFCSHQEKVLLSASWRNNITSVGQKFEGGVVEFRTFLCKYAIEVGFQFTYVKNDKLRVTAECAYKESRGCMWRVHASVEKTNGFFYIRTLNNEHTCGVAVRMSKHLRMTSSFVSGLILEEVSAKPLTRPVDVVKEMKDKYGVSISYNCGWLGVEKAKCSTYGDSCLSFD